MDQLPATSDEVFTLPIGSRLDLSHQAFVFCVLACSLAKNPRKASARLPGLPHVDEPGSGFVARRNRQISSTGRRNDHTADVRIAIFTVSTANG
jgi:hypothetical protein